MAKKVLSVIYERNPAIVPYQPEDYKNHNARFVYYRGGDGKDEVLLVGRHERYGWPDMHVTLRRVFCGEPVGTPYDYDAAGSIKDGEIVEWHDLAYQVGTPEELKPRILELLQLPENVPEVVIPEPTINYYEVEVDYSLTLEEAIAAGDYVTYTMRSVLDGRSLGLGLQFVHSTSPDANEGKRVVRVAMVWFNRSFRDAARVEAALAQHSLRPADKYVLLAFGAKHLELLDERFPLIVTKELYERVDGSMGALALRTTSDGRPDANLWPVGALHEGVRYLAFDL